MALEIEKKYRLTGDHREQVRERLRELGAEREGEEFEVNTLYAGATLETGHSVLRLRRIGERGILTYKERVDSSSDLKHQHEDETRVDDPDAMDAILKDVGFRPALVYEKRRETWRLGNTEIVIDELPFGLFMEIEGSEQGIREVEGKLAIADLRTEVSTYPNLSLQHGSDRDGVIEARFPS